MGKVFGSSSYINHGGRIFPLMLALAACLFWASAAQAQAPFNSQYDPPPTAPPECGASSDGSSCDPASYTPTSYSSPSAPPASYSSPSAPPASYSPAAPAAPAAAPAAPAAAPAAPAAPAATPAAPSGTTTETLLPTTGGLGLAPILLGAAIIAAAGIFTVRRRR